MPKKPILKTANVDKSLQDVELSMSFWCFQNPDFFYFMFFFFFCGVGGGRWNKDVWVCGRGSKLGC